MIVAIDGPAGAGKSTVASRLAERVGFRYLDTGAMYRALTWLAMREGIPLAEGEGQGELAELGDAVIEGREIGTVVCPEADVKIYLKADRAVREQRRLAERPDIGADALATDLRARDESDAARMQPAEDAEVIDTSELDVGDVVGRIEELVRARLPA